MALKPVEVAEIPKSNRGSSKTRVLINEFLESGLEAAEVEGDFGKGFVSGLNAKAKRDGHPVRAMRRNDVLYLVHYDWSENGEDAPEE